MFGSRGIHLDWMVDTLRRDQGSQGAPWVGNINIAMVTASIELQFNRNKVAF